MSSRAAADSSGDLLARTFVELADTLVHDFDIVAFLELLSMRCVSLLDVSAAGVMLLDSSNTLRVVASSDEDAHTLELMELQDQEGPCLDAFHAQSAVQALLSDAIARWPQFTTQAQGLGYHAFSAVPLRLRNQTIGVLNLFDSKEQLLREDDLRHAQALADIATIGMLNERTLRESRLVAEQLQRALTSRVVLEQAKGFLAVKLDCRIEDAYLVMREYARNNNLRLSDLAHSIIAGHVDPESVQS